MAKSRHPFTHMLGEYQHEWVSNPHGPSGRLTQPSLPHRPQTAGKKGHTEWELLGGRIHGNGNTRAIPCRLSDNTR